MQTLPATFYSTGWNFTLIKRTGLVCLYSKHKRGHKLTHFEVVIAIPRPAHTWPNGQTTEAHESFPSPEQWGTYGWTPYDLAAAHRRFDHEVRLRHNA